MTLAELGDALQVEGLPARLAGGWAEAAARFSGQGAAFLSDTALDEVFRACQFPEDVATQLTEAVAVARRNPALFQLAWLWHTVLFAADDPPESAEWPGAEAALGEMAGMFPAVVMLSGLSHMLTVHRARRIPAEITQATASDLAIWIRHYHRLRGRWGFSQLPWMMRHCRGGLFRLGRLQFEPIPFSHPLRVFKHRVSGEVLALSEAGASYTREGLLNGTNHVDDARAWVADLTVADGVICGHPIDPMGYARRETVTLPAADWAQRLTPGDAVLNLHIPEDGKMAHDACGASLAAAEGFFARHCPEMPPPAAYVCGSWLLDSQLQAILPPNANIVQFQREFYLAPLLSHQQDVFGRIFGGMPADLTQAPRDTALRRAVLDFTLAGHALRGGYGFILRDDLQWGAQRYQG